jgi:putative FmdB family regulatory protein
MPIYKYSCEKCGSHVEVIQKISDPPPKRCAKCRGKLIKDVSRTSFQLKGSGWYATDYPTAKTASAGKGNNEKGNDKPDKGVSEKSDHKTDKVASDKKSESVSKITASGDKD